MIFIDIATRNDRVHTGHQIIVVLARIVVVNFVRERVTVTRRPTRVGVQNDVACCCVQLNLGRELWAIGRERSAVYFENERIFFLRIEMRWCRYPALYFKIIGR